jgi:CMP-N-acetylneuraminic acid synthetase
LLDGSNPDVILALIPARGGSKGLPRKNILPVGGKPLIAWRIESALACNAIDRVIVSTDDEEIADVARRFGADVPFLRPPEIAQDETPMLDVTLHLLDWLTEDADYLLLLQPTSPLCGADDLQNAITLARQKNANAVVSVAEVSKHPYWMKTINPDGYLQNFLPEAQTPIRRQDLPVAYALNGAIYLIRPEILRAERTFVPAQTLPYIMPPERSLDVDSAWDLQLVNLILQNS